MIAKTLLSTLLRKKTRTLLLLFSIAACASLLFANVGFQKTCEQMIYNADTRWSGNSELIIHPKQSVGAEEWINPDLLASYNNQLEYAYRFIRCNAFYAPSSDYMHYFTALGTDIKEFNIYNPLTLESGNIDDWTGNKLILGTTYAKMLGVSIGDTLPLEIAGESYTFQIAGISQPKGLFTRELADGGYLLMPRETLADILGGQCNLIFLKTNDASSVPTLMRTLEDSLPQYYVRLGINHAVIQAETNNYVMPFWVSSVIVIFMSVFIIYSSFHLIVNERISILGILRSVGCTRKKTSRILILESMIIGIVGGAIGCVLGIGVLHVLKNVYFSGESAIIDAPVLFGVREVLFAIVVSTIITMLSAVLPIIRVTKEPVKNIILNDFQKKKLKNAKLWPLGVLLLLPCFIVPMIINKGFMGMMVASVAATLALLGLNLLIPLFCRLAAFATRSFSHEIALGVRNAGDFEALVNNIRLFATTLAIMVFMMTIFNTLGTDLKNMNKQNNYDISIILRNSDSQTLEKLSQTDGVADFYGIYKAPATIINHGTFMNQLIGIDNEDYFKFFPAQISPETNAALNALDDGNSIVTTNILRDKLGLKIGDILTLRLENGVVDYKITGFLDTNRGIGHVGYISSEHYKAVMGVQYYSTVYVKAYGDPNVVKNNIQRIFSRDILSIQTKQELEVAEADKVIGIFNAINTYAYFAMLIGVLGIINNMVACFLGRRRNLALYRCIGMSAKSAGRMLMTEAVVIGVIGALAGLGIGIIMVQTVPFVVGMLWGNVISAVPLIKITIMCIAGIVAMLLSSLVPFIKGKNISIMDNIRYE